jgi:hypothetical protein
MTYDSSGRAVSAQEGTQHGSLDAQSQHAWTYNALGDVLTYDIHTVEDGVAYESTRTHTFDAVGNRTAEHELFDYLADGTPEFMSDWIASYDPRNAPTLFTFQSAEAEGGDAEAWRQVFVNDTSLTDGVFYLVRSYFPEEDR